MLIPSYFNTNLPFYHYFLSEVAMVLDLSRMVSLCFRKPGLEYLDEKRRATNIFSDPL